MDIGQLKTEHRQETLLAFEHLSLSFRPHKKELMAVNELSLEIKRGEIFALAGESGCGKSVLLRSVLRLLPEHARLSGSILYEGQDLTKLSERNLRQLRGREIGAVFQDPFNALNPTKAAGRQLADQAARTLGLSQAAAEKRALELFDLLQIERGRERFYQLPHELSGGMRQRIALGLALAGKPKLLLADEITTALDVTVQAKLLQLLRDLRNELKLTIILVSHDLALPALLADRIGVMYAGRIVEQGSMTELYQNPSHPYTRALYQALPERCARGQQLFTLPGVMPAASFAGDPFALRNKDALTIDFLKRPPLFALSPTHFAASWALHPQAQAAKQAADKTAAKEHSNVLSPEKLPEQSAAQVQIETGSALALTSASRSSSPAELLSDPSSCAFAQQPEPLLSVQDLSVVYPLGESPIAAVDHVSFEVQKGEILALVGESGCGKSSLARCLALLQKPSAGTITFKGRQLSSGSAFYELRQKIQLIFQGGALNLQLRLFDIIAEPLISQRLCPRSELRPRVLELMALTSLDASLIDARAEELSGGQLQRAAIARALAVKPELLIADEPTAALDVLTQAEIINLLTQLKREQGLTIVLITHDLHLVRCIADRTALMLQGKIVELAPAPVIFKYARHPYSKTFIAALPSADPKRAQEKLKLKLERPELPERGRLQLIHPGHYIYKAD